MPAVAGLLAALASHGLADKAACKHTCQFLTTLAKADNFEMTLMFMEDKEQKLIVKIMDAVNTTLKGEKLPQDLARAFNL